MNKTELIHQIAERSDEKKTTVERVVNELFDTIRDEMAAGGEVAITGFGTFAVVERGERQGRNPKTGEPVTVAACKAVKFKAGKLLKEAANA